MLAPARSKPSFTGADPVSVGRALRQARRAPQVLEAEIELEGARQRFLDARAAAGAAPRDQLVSQEAGRALSFYGVWALCLPSLAGLFLGSQLGGDAGLLSFFCLTVGGPVLSLLAVERWGRSRGSQRREEFEARLRASQEALHRAEDRLDSALVAQVADRLGISTAEAERIARYG